MPAAWRRRSHARRRSLPPPGVDRVHGVAAATDTEPAAALPTVLLIDDDRVYRAAIGQYIRSNGFDCLEADSFAQGLERVQARERVPAPERMPGLERVPGQATSFVIVAELTVDSRHLFDCIAQLRRPPNAPLLVLTGHREETEKIVALELGADDFIAKSVDRREILARIRVAARRLLALPGGSPATGSGSPQRSGTATGAWQFLRISRTLIDPAGRSIRLTAAEFDLLAAFVENTGRPMSREQLATAALGRHSYASDRGIDNLVAKLRRKLGDSARIARMIKTARPVGYVFTGFSAAPAGEAPH